MTERPILFSGEMVRAILDGRKTQTRRLIDLERLRADVPRPITEEINGHHLGSTRAGRFRIGMNPQGAVFKLSKNGKTFGLKPGEFNFACPYADGRTWITPKTPDRSAPWTITPEGSQRLWVRETFTHITGNGIRVHYRADGEPTDSEGRVLPTEAGLPRWRPSIFMRRSESRITLEITEVRVQRLQEISEDDARAEGVVPYTPPNGRISPEQRVPGPGFDRCRLGDQPHRLPFADLWDRINGKRAAWASNPWVWAITFRRIP